MDAGKAGAPPTKPAVSRARWARINRGLLLSDTGEAVPLSAGAKLTLNLFPDTIYTGVIDEIQQDGDAYTWIGHLEGVDHSSLFIVFTAGVFAGHFASPGGIYEVSIAGDDLYQIIQVDQSKLQGGEGDLTIPSQDT